MSRRKYTNDNSGVAFFMWLGFVTLLLAVLLSVAGCQASVRKQVTIANDSLAATINAIADLRDGGKISEAKLTALRPYIIAAVSASNDATRSAAAGDENATRVYLNAFYAALEKLKSEVPK